MANAVRTRRVGGNSDRWLSVVEVAEHLGVKQDTVYKWIIRKRLPAHKAGRLWKFKISEIDRWVRNHPVSSGASF